MCSGSELTARIVGELDGVQLVYLYNDSDDSGETINTHLVSKGFAWLSTLRENLETVDPEALQRNQDELGMYKDVLFGVCVMHEPFQLVMSCVLVDFQDKIGEKSSHVSIKEVTNW